MSMGLPEFRIEDPNKLLERSSEGPTNFVFGLKREHNIVTLTVEVKGNLFNRIQRIFNANTTYNINEISNVLNENSFREVGNQIFVGEPPKNPNAQEKTLIVPARNVTFQELKPEIYTRISSIISRSPFIAPLTLTVDSSELSQQTNALEADLSPPVEIDSNRRTSEVKAPALPAKTPLAQTQQPAVQISPKLTVEKSPLKVDPVELSPRADSEVVLREKIGTSEVIVTHAQVVAHAKKLDELRDVQYEFYLPLSSNEIFLEKDKKGEDTSTTESSQFGIKFLKENSVSARIVNQELQVERTGSNPETKIIIVRPNKEFFECKNDEKVTLNPGDQVLLVAGDLAKKMSVSDMQKACQGAEMKEIPQRLQTLYKQRSTTKLQTRENQQVSRNSEEKKGLPPSADKKILRKPTRVAEIVDPQSKPADIKPEEDLGFHNNVTAIWQPPQDAIIKEVLKKLANEIATIDETLTMAQQSIEDSSVLYIQAKEKFEIAKQVSKFFTDRAEPTNGQISDLKNTELNESVDFEGKDQFNEVQIGKDLRQIYSHLFNAKGGITDANSTLVEISAINEKLTGAVKKDSTINKKQDDVLRDLKEIENDKNRVNDAVSAIQKTAEEAKLSAAKIVKDVDSFLEEAKHKDVEIASPISSVSSSFSTPYDHPSSTATTSRSSTPNSSSSGSLTPNHAWNSPSPLTLPEPMEISLSSSQMSAQPELPSDKSTEVKSDKSSVKTLPTHGSITMGRGLNPSALTQQAKFLKQQNTRKAVATPPSSTNLPPPVSVAVKTPNLTESPPVKMDDKKNQPVKPTETKTVPAKPAVIAKNNQNFPKFKMG